jgi:hypothetical protein
MNTKINYAEVCLLYPDLVKEVMDKLRKGKSIHKDATPEKLKWYYNDCKKIAGVVYAENAAEIKPEQEELKNIIFVRVYAEIGRWHGFSDSNMSVIPPEIIDLYYKKFPTEKNVGQWWTYETIRKSWL